MEGKIMRGEVKVPALAEHKSVDTFKHTHVIQPTCTTIVIQEKKIYINILLENCTRASVCKILL